MHHPSSHFFLATFFKNALNELYLNNFIRTFAIGLIYSFIPIFLLDNDYNLFDALMLFAAMYLFLVVMAPFSVWVAEKIGVKHTLLLNVPITLGFFFFMYTLLDFQWPLWVLSLMYSGVLAFYWMPYNIMFSHDSKKKKSGSEVGIYLALANIAGLFAPLVGAFIIETQGFMFTFIFCSVLLAISIVPLFFTNDWPVDFEWSWLRFFSKKHLFPGIYFFFEGILGVTLIVWPIFIYLTKVDYLFIGFMGMLSGVGAAIFTYLLGKFDDVVGDEQILRIGGGIMAVIWFIPIFFSNPLIFSLLSFFQGFVVSMISLPLFAKSCRLGKQYGPSDFMIFRETVLSIGRLVAFAVILFTLDFKILFVLSVIASIFFVFAKVNENLK